jgi:carboxyl-terminal processing protease
MKRTGLSHQGWRARGALAAGLIFALSQAVLAAEEVSNVQTGATDNLMKPVAEMMEVISNLKLPLDSQKASKAVIEALIRTADPMGRVMTDKEIAQMQVRQQGLVYETPITFSSTNGLPAITDVKPDSTAAQVGLRNGDLIEKIDGQELLSNMAPVEVTRMLRSPVLTPAFLTVRGVNEKSREVQLSREERRLPAIDKMEEWPVDFCYLKLNGFYDGAGKTVVSNLQQWSRSGRFGVIIDLRGAGGTDLDSAGKIAGLFADDGAVLFTLRDSENQDLQVVKNTEATHIGMPAMVLVDDQTTGASEVLAAALEASVRGAMLLGQPTAGDPMIREIVPLPTGEKLYVATRRLVMANGKVYDGREGVTPAVEVTASADMQTEYEPSTPLAGAKELSEEEKEHRQLRERVRGDATLRRAVDVLLGLKALNIRGFGKSETRAD